jgi:hypothetical protein
VGWRILQRRLLGVITAEEIDKGVTCNSFVFFFVPALDPSIDFLVQKREGVHGLSTIAMIASIVNMRVQKAQELYSVPTPDNMSGLQNIFRSRQTTGVAQ